MKNYSYSFKLYKVTKEVEYYRNGQKKESIIQEHLIDCFNTSEEKEYVGVQRILNDCQLNINERFYQLLLLFKPDSLITELDKKNNEIIELNAVVASQRECIEKVNSTNQESVNSLENQIKLTNEDLVKTTQQLAFAMKRLNQRSINSGVVIGESRQENLRETFKEFQRGLFYDTTTIIFNEFKEAKNLNLKFSSLEFFTIQSILSQHVFIDGMSYFAVDKSEIDASVNSIINNLSGSEELNLDPAKLVIIQQKIEAALFKTKGYDNSGEALNQHIQKTTEVILRDLEEQLHHSCFGKKKEIEDFVSSGLKLVQDIVCDRSAGEFYMPNPGTEFDENLHESRDEIKDKIKLTIYAGYCIPGDVLVKAKVVTNDSDKKNVLPSTADKSQDKSIPDQKTQSQISVASKIPSGSPDASNLEIHFIKKFQGKVVECQAICPDDPRLNPSPIKDYANFTIGSIINFDAWTFCNADNNENQDNLIAYRVYQDVLWVWASHIELVENSLDFTESPTE
jgi:hypothetical protein